MRFVTRARVIHTFLTLIVVAAGLATRLIKRRYPVLGDAAGDALWATMVFLLLGLFFPAVNVWKRAALALAISFAVEFSQIYHAPWIDRIRARPLGAMILGSTFVWMDLVNYAAGVGLGLGLDWLMLRRK